jgi:hypothetical protein
MHLSIHGSLDATREEESRLIGIAGIVGMNWLRVTASVLTVAGRFTRQPRYPHLKPMSPCRHLNNREPEHRSLRTLYGRCRVRSNDLAPTLVSGLAVTETGNGPTGPPRLFALIHLSA